MNVQTSESVGNGALNSFRLCEQCEEPIPARRLQAKPDAKLCVPCLQKNGDEPKVRRFDEYLDNGETCVEHYFTKPNQYLQEQIRRFQGDLQDECYTALKTQEQ